jgi:hypothetical protein
VICSENVIEARGAPLGVYRDSPVSGWVMFKGMQYRFDRVTEGERIRAGELLLRPGLVYVLV